VAAPRKADTTGATGPALELRDAHVVVSGQTVLSGLDLRIRPNEHVAIVGPSGAGKSSLLGIFLGWHELAAGEAYVDSRRFDAAELESLRRATAWIDPAVHLYNRTLEENVAFGATDQERSIERALEAAELTPTLAKLPNGLRTRIGMSGTSLSGGEGQRVRVARAIHRQPVRLALLDEPFRGLDRDARRRLLGACRSRYRSATLLCVSHDLADTTTFDRILVVEEGRIVEDGRPAELLERPASRYATLMAAERRAESAAWGDPRWRRLSVSRGRIEELP
jgi:ATP-binding cassette subfamily B protein